MGNICRSPTAEGVMRGLLREQGLEDAVEVDSAGTPAGAPPARRPGEAAPAPRVRPHVRRSARSRRARSLERSGDEASGRGRGGDDGFERVLDLVEAACRGLLERLRADGRL